MKEEAGLSLREEGKLIMTGGLAFTKTAMRL